MSNFLVVGSTFAESWLLAARKLLDNSGDEITPFLVKIRPMPIQSAPQFQLDFERDLDELLIGKSREKIQTTASTIFPASINADSRDVFERFDKVWKYVRKHRLNRNGHYFRRLTSYGSKGAKVNQLEHIIKTYNGEDSKAESHRRSALIASIFDPNKDHTRQRVRGFPCLHQVCFVPKPEENSLTINATYAMQYLFDRAYGNYIGLANLGGFVANEMGLELDEVNCFSSVLKIGSINKTDLGKIVEKYETYI